MARDLVPDAPAAGGRGRRRFGVWLLLGAAFLLFFLPPLVRLIAEWPWFTALGGGGSGLRRN